MPLPPVGEADAAADAVMPLPMPREAAASRRRRVMLMPPLLEVAGGLVDPFKQSAPADAFVPTHPDEGGFADDVIFGHESP